jgi:hydroxymethylpyrimidine pyrophosphatase-like HAD family hydrolase
VGKFDGILICTDLDGTLYKNDKTISKENKEAIEYFKREGGYFTFITGRMPYYSLNAYNAINPNVPFGCVNGGGLYDGQNRRYIWNQPMADGVFERSVTAAQAIGYKELFPYLNGEASLEDCIDELKRASRRYAKRQITWFSGKEYAHKVFLDDENGLKEFEDIVNNLKKLF